MTGERIFALFLVVRLKDGCVARGPLLYVTLHLHIQLLLLVTVMVRSLKGLTLDSRLLLKANPPRPSCTQLAGDCGGQKRQNMQS